MYRKPFCWWVWPLSAAAAILEEIHHAGCNGAACHAQMYIMGTLLRHGMPYFENSYATRGAPILSRDVARDFGIPAVVCPGATQQIPDGATVQIDGNHGVISVVKEEAT